MIERSIVMACVEYGSKVEIDLRTLSVVYGRQCVLVWSCVEDRGWSCLEDIGL